MSRGIESTRALDANVEKKNLEGTYKSKNNSGESILNSWDLTEQTRKRDAERKASYILGSRFGGFSGIGFSEDPFKTSMPAPKFTATDIGKETINAPTQDKMEAQRVESELETIRESSKEELDK